MRGILTVVLAGCIVWSATLHADEILLRNGNVIRGDIIVQDESAVKIKVFFGEDQSEDSSVVMEIPTERIRRVTKEGSLFKPQSRTSIKTTPAPDMLDTSAATPTPGTEETESDSGEETPPTPTPTEPEATTATEAPALDPALKRQADLLLQNLANTDNDTRAQASDRLAAMGKDVVPLMVKKLMDAENAVQKIALMRLLGNSGDKRAILALLDQMRSPNAFVMRNAWLALKNLSGQVHFFDESHDARRRAQYIENWMNWFEKNEADLPVQIGYEARQEALKRAEEAATNTTTRGAP